MPTNRLIMPDYGHDVKYESQILMLENIKNIK